MRRRLVTAVLALVALVGVASGTAHGDTTRPIRGVQIQSPAKFVLPKKPPQLTLPQRAVRLARRQLGVPYVWGGASPSGFDCSGLVSWVYGRLGISLPHNAAALYGVGRPIRRSRLRPGDLLFFHGLGHVGIYIGRGRMIHAPQSGRDVEIQSLAVRRGSLVGARRVA
jgi:cell wall-associated NlpC family hydrolase